MTRDAKTFLVLILMYLSIGFLVVQAEILISNERLIMSGGHELNMSPPSGPFSLPLYSTSCILWYKYDQFTNDQGLCIDYSPSSNHWADYADGAARPTYVPAAGNQSAYLHFDSDDFSSTYSNIVSTNFNFSSNGQMTVMFWCRSYDWVSKGMYSPGGIADGDLSGASWNTRVGGTFNDASWSLQGVTWYDWSGSTGWAGTVSNTVPATGQWLHVAYVLDTNATPTIRIYLDGVNQTLRENTVTNISTEYRLNIGSLWDTSFDWNGDIDEWTILDRAYNAIQVQYVSYGQSGSHTNP